MPQTLQSVPKLVDPSFLNRFSSVLPSDSSDYVNLWALPELYSTPRPYSGGTISISGIVKYLKGCWWRWWEIYPLQLDQFIIISPGHLTLKEWEACYSIKLHSKSGFLQGRFCLAAIPLLGKPCGNKSLITYESWGSCHSLGCMKEEREHIFFPLNISSRWENGATLLDSASPKIKTSEEISQKEHIWAHFRVWGKDQLLPPNP